MRNKILMSAFSCLPDRGSEPGVGWNWAIQAAKTQDVYVLTRTKSRKMIEGKIPEDVKGTLHFLYCPSSSKLRKISIYLEYILWQYTSYIYIKKISKNINFDYIWHITFGNMLLPTFMWKLNIPFIWGPIGGVEQVPDSFYKRFSTRDKFPHFIKKVLIKTLLLNPLILATANHSNCIIVRTENSRDVLPKKYHAKTYIHLETGVDKYSNEIVINDDYEAMNEVMNEEKINVVMTGRLIALKNVSLLITAFAEAYKKCNNLFLHFVGDGDQKDELIQLCKKLNVEDKVKFYGQLLRGDALTIVKKADIFAFSSLIEGASFSLIEAMMLSKPIICLDRSGMHLVTSDKCAIRVPVTNFEETSHKFADALISMAIDPQKRVFMGMASKERIDTVFTWNAIGEFIEDIITELEVKT